MKCGLIPHDPVKLAKAPRIDKHALASMVSPTTLNRAGINYLPLLGDNDKIGDCTSVGLANYAIGVGSLTQSPPPIDTAHIVDFYSHSTNYDPSKVLPNGTNPTDTGAQELDILAYQLQHGYKINNDLLVGDWATYIPQDGNLMRNVVTYYGLSYLGVALGLADQTDNVWDTTNPGDQTPGSWGYHSLNIWDFDGIGDTDLVSLVTWGSIQKATWRWIRSRVTEAHVVIFRQLLQPNNQNWIGLDYDTLKADLQTYMSY